MGDRICPVPSEATQDTEAGVPPFTEEMEAMGNAPRRSSPLASLRNPSSAAQAKQLCQARTFGARTAGNRRAGFQTKELVPCFSCGNVASFEEAVLWAMSSECDMDYP
jgi:hypothetical protein